MSLSQWWGTLKDSMLDWYVRRMRLPAPENVPLLFAELLRRHGYRAIEQVNQVRVPAHGVTFEPCIAQTWVNGEWTTVQLDVYMKSDDGRIWVDSCAGFGRHVFDAVADALGAFAAGTFHVILAVHLGARPSGHTEIETWTIAGSPWTATCGPYLKRGSQFGNSESVERFGQFVREALAKQDLPPGRHWLRLFYGHSPKPTIEAVLDSVPWQPMQEAMCTFAWPSSDTYYSLRRFVILERR